MLTEERIIGLTDLGTLPASRTESERLQAVYDVLCIAVAETAEACAVMADEEAKKWWIRDEFSRFAAAIREKARTK